MSPIVRAELGEYLRYVALDGLLCNGKLGRDLFVRVPGRDPPEHIDLARGQVVLRGMVSQLDGDLRGYSLLASMDSADCVQEFSMHVSLQYVTPGARFQSPQHLDVACVRGQ